MSHSTGNPSLADSVPFEENVALCAVPPSQSTSTSSSVQTSPLQKPLTILPATYRATKDFVNKTRLKWPTIRVITDATSKHDFIHHELDLTGLNKIHPHLWLAGLPGRLPSPLHEQLIKRRTIAVTQRLDQHLVWSQDNILYLKPLARHFLDYEVWQKFICPFEEDLASARGFLLSYLWLISSESDFIIALESRLLPEGVKWSQWTAFAKSVASRIDITTRASVNKRFAYAELRMSRLNVIYRFCSMTRGLSTLVRGYSYGYTTYASFFERNTAWLLIAIIYITIVLTAMQVGLGTSQLQGNAAFNRASYGFTVLSILGPLVVLVGMSIFVLLLVVFNLLYVLGERKRAQEQFKGLFTAENVQKHHYKGEGGKSTAVGTSA